MAATSSLISDTPRTPALGTMDAVHWSRTWWFHALIPLTLGAFIFGLYRLIAAWLKRRTRVLELWVEERTHELRAEVARRQSVEEALQRSEERYSLALRGTNDGIFDWNLATNRLYYSPRFEAILGYPEGSFSDEPEEWLGRIHPDDARKVKAKLATHRDGTAELFDDEHRMRHRDGSYRWVLFRAFIVRNERGLCSRIVGAMSDVTDRRAFDPLTGLPNRALFLERLTDSVARSRRDAAFRFAVLFLDLDRFNLINNTYGHLAGDTLLAAVSQRFSSCLRPGDIMARLGGDEFAVVMAHPASVEEASSLAMRCCDVLREPFMLGDAEVVVTATIGIAQSELGYEKGEDLLRDADIAMYRARAEKGHGPAVFDVGMRERVTEKVRLESELRRAVENREMEVHYQPIVALESGDVRGFEALLRWRHPRRGMLLPEEFIPLAEETGLIVPIGYWTLEEACRQSMRFSRRQKEGPPLTLSVNMSGKQFSEPDLAHRVRTILEGVGFDPGQLHIEITESVLIETSNGMPRRLRELRDLDIKIDIDDFGKGYSSLSYLTSLPITALKIDRAFVSRIQEKDDSAALVRLILSLSHGMQIAAIAEGVETSAQRDYLKIHGCDLAQGFFFSAAVEAERVPVLLFSPISPSR